MTSGASSELDFEQRDGSPVWIVAFYADRLSVSTTGAVYIDADYRSITRLELWWEASWQIVLDVVTFRLPS